MTLIENRAEPKNITQVIKRENQVGKAPTAPRSAVSMKMVKDVRSVDKHLNIKGTVKKINSVRNFTRKDGSIGKVGSFQLSDTTGSIKVVLWDEKRSILSYNNFKLDVPLTLRMRIVKLILITERMKLRYI